MLTLQNIAEAIRQDQSNQYDSFYFERIYWEIHSRIYDAILSNQNCVKIVFIVKNKDENRFSKTIGKILPIGNSEYQTEISTVPFEKFTKVTLNISWAATAL